MSRFFLIALCVLIAPWPLLAQDLRPAEPPPHDFQAMQYIDSQGCVFLLDGGRWLARLADDGAPICGFPPSLATHGAGEAPRGGMAAIEHDLTVAIISEEGGESALPPAAPAIGHAAPEPGHEEAGETPVSALAGNEMEPSQAVSKLTRQTDETRAEDVSAAIARELQVVPAIAAKGTRAGFDPATRLCGLLGLSEGGGVQISSDPTRGACSGRPEDLWKLRQLRSAAKPAAQDAGAASSDPVKKVAAKPLAAPQKGAAAAPITAKGVKQEAKKAPAAPAAAGRTAAPAKPAVPDPAARPADMAKAETGSDPKRKMPGDERRAEIPAGAKYIQVGRFTLDMELAVIARLQRLGYPVLQERLTGPGTERRIMVGPFPSRERLISALDRLRKEGFPGAFAL